MFLMRILKILTMRRQLDHIDQQLERLRQLTGRQA